MNEVSIVIQPADELESGVLAVQISILHVGTAFVFMNAHEAMELAQSLIKPFAEYIPQDSSPNEKAH